MAMLTSSLPIPLKEQHSCELVYVRNRLCAKDNVRVVLSLLLINYYILYLLIRHTFVVHCIS
jgi:hypothetical protein